MKRIGNLYGQICSMENLIAADQIAQKGKSRQSGVIQHNRSREANLAALQQLLIDKQFKTSPYKTFTILDPKEREIYCLPYYPDRIVHHAIMRQLEEIFVSVYTADTYSCIKGRGIHSAAGKIKSALKDTASTRYCLKLDIKKFYPSVDHSILKALLRRKFKDRDLLALLDEIIDSADGLPIGNYLSQYLANYYLTFFDHWLKEYMGVRYYFRYADDIVILSGSKRYLHALLANIRRYLAENLKLQVKNNYQVFPVSQTNGRGIDFLGYVFFHTHIRLRKSIKQNFAKMLISKRNEKSIASYMGWLKYCNSVNLTKKLM